MRCPKKKRAGSIGRPGSPSTPRLPFDTPRSRFGVDADSEGEEEEGSAGGVGGAGGAGGESKSAEEGDKEEGARKRLKTN